MLAEELARKIKTIVDGAWRQEQNTTMNSMMEYIVRETGYLFLDEINMIKDRVVELSEENEKLNTIVEELIDEELKNASKDGGIPQPQRNTKASNESPVRSQKGRQSTSQPINGNA